MTDSHLLKAIARHYCGNNLKHQRRLIRKLMDDPRFIHHLQSLNQQATQARQALMLPKLRTPEMLMRPPATQRKQPEPKPIAMRIANVMAGQPFSEVIAVQDVLDGVLSITHIHAGENFEACDCDENTLTISGTANQPGDYKLSLSCLLYLPSGERQALKGELKITVIPDPKTLWKNLPSDESARFHKPDFDSLRLTGYGVQLLGGSVRGRSHAHKGTHRDDDFTLLAANNADEWNVICVADGAGSCPYSRRGSQIASEQASQVLSAALNSQYGEKLPAYYKALAKENTADNQQRLQQVYQQTMVKAAHAAAMKIQEEVNQHPDDSFKDYSTTLLLAAHKPLADGHLVFAFWVGDGGAVIYRKNQEAILLGKPDGGQFAGQTRFLDKKIFEDGSVYSRIFLTKVPDLSALILATDGITDPWFDSEREMAEVEKWDSLWAEVAPFVETPNTEEACEGLVEWLNFWSPGHHDDRSIAICSVTS